MDRHIIEASQLPEADKVYLRKDIFGWRIVHPIKDESGKVRPINLVFGGWRNLFNLVLLICGILIILAAYNHDVTQVHDFCKNISSSSFNRISTPIYGGDMIFNGTARFAPISPP